MKKYHKSISIVFPAFNEEKNIEILISEAIDFAKEYFKDFEIIVVNDGSTDKTRELVESIAKKKKRLKLINNRTNLGYGATVCKGLKAATKDLIFFSDADRQFDLKEISKILNQIEEYDVVIGYRRKRRDPYLRKINALGWKLLIRLLLNLKVRDVDCAFKLFKKEVIKKLKIKSTGATFSAELIYLIKKQGHKILEIPVSHFPRIEGRPTGAKLSVIKRAFAELWQFYRSQDDLVQAKSKYVYFLGVIILFLSRILLRSNSLDFFDSSEYMWRSNDASILKAMSTGHAPFHPLYVFFGWLLHFGPMKFSEVVSLEITSAVMGTLSIVFLFLFIRKLFNSRMAWLSTTIFALLPFVWVSQTTVLVDATEHAFYFLSLLLWLLALNSNNAKSKLLALVAGLAFGASAFAHTQVGIWGLSILALPIATQVKFNKTTMLDLLYKFILFGLGSAVFIFLYLKLLVYAHSTGWHDPSTSMLEAFKYLVFGNIGDRDPIELKKAIYYLVSLASTLLVISSIFGAVKLFINDRRKLFFLALWFLPFIIGSTYVYENLYARTLIIGLAPIAVLASYFILSLKKAKIIVMLLVLIQLCFLSIPVISKYYKLPAPIEHIKSTVSQTDRGGIFVSSNLTKTLANSAYDGEFVNFGDVGNGAGYVEEKVNNAIGKNLPVYILSDALILPYHRYDGAYYDLRSTGVGSSTEHITMLDNIISKYALSLKKVDDLGFSRELYEISQNRPTDEIDRITSNLKSSPIIFGKVQSDKKPVSGLIINSNSKMICNAPEGDITRLDVGFCLMRSFSGAKRYGSWTYTDKDGYFALAVGENESSPTFSANAALTKSENLKSEFAKQEDINPGTDMIGEFSDSAKLKEETEKLESFYVISNLKNDKPQFRLYKMNFKLPTANEIKARDLGGEVSEVVRDRAASEKVRLAKSNAGFALSGPYKNLESGKYKIIFKARTTKAGQDSVVFDVSSDYAREVLAGTELKLSDLKSDRYKDISIEFETDENKKAIEFRVKVPENSGLLLDSVLLIKQ